MKKILIIFILFLGALTCVAQKHTPDHYDYAIRQAFKEGRWDAGKYMLDEAEPYYGKLSAFYELKGWYYYHNHEYVEARYNLSNSLQDDNSNTNARTILSKVEEETGHYSAAICYINELLEHNPYNKSLWIRKIDMYKRLGNTVEADRLVKRLSEIYPNDEDVKSLYEEEFSGKLKTARTNGDIQSQISISKDLVKVNPSADNYLAYTNALLGAGYLSEALNVSAEGANKTGSYALIKKHCDILLEQGKYTEALNYLNNFKGNSQAQKLRTTIEKEQATMASQYDPYMVYSKLYYKTHDKESFNNVVNIGIVRGYYYDVIDVINDYKKRNNNVGVDVLYKEYTAYHRLGNDDKAAAILELISQKGGIANVSDEMCETYYKQGNELLSNKEYDKAISKFRFIVENSKDAELISTAKDRLFTCYFEEGKYNDAISMLPDSDYLKHSMVYDKLGDYKKAMDCVIGKDSVQYCEMAIKYIKTLMDKKNYKEAFSQTNTVLAYADYPELYMYAISSGTKLNNDVSAYILTGYEKYPKDDYFINQYCGYMNTEALKAYKAKDYDLALSRVNDGLEKDENNAELKNTKGLIYEKIKQYELSYEFQKDYKPGILDGYEFRKKMQGLQSKTYLNEIDVFYQFRRNETEDTHYSLVGCSYNRLIKKHSITGYGNYISRDGNTSMAIQLGCQYEYSFKYDITASALFMYGTNYLFPRYIFTVSCTKGLPKDWTIGGKFSYKYVQSLDSTGIINKNIFDIGISTSKTINNVVMSLNTDLFVISKNVYFNMAGKVDYFPLECNKTKLFIAAGGGTAPEVTITDNMLPMSIRNLNTFISGGFSYCFNQHIALGATGSWYTLFNNDNNKRYINHFYIIANAAIRF